MTFGELKQVLFDRMGLEASTPIASTVTRVERMVNEAANMVATSQEWPWLENASNTVVMVSGTKTYFLDPTLADVLSIVGATGPPLTQFARDTFEDFLRGDVTASALPTAFTVDGMQDTTLKLSITVWPDPNTGATLTVRGHRRISEMTSDANVPEIPSELHYMIADNAIALLRESEESPMAELVAIKAGQATASAIASQKAGQLGDNT